MYKLLLHILCNKHYETNFHTNLYINNILKKLSQDAPQVGLVFTTIVHGVGCYLRHVKIVIHAAYTQEIGRAGRDGSRTQAIYIINLQTWHNDMLTRSSKTFLKSQISAEDCFNVNFHFDPPTIIPSLEQRNQVMEDYMTADGTVCCNESKINFYNILNKQYSHWTRVYFFNLNCLG
ncbi:hypothetical protein ACJMK2_018497 [Sinanodonta woodiana]|uniref:Helicase C-terminal domain-containing protein n=1 Tax=Sinanodonta woodiana TaxID=1069815 RepID=A0ABD3UDL9_SINWO